MDATATNKDASEAQESASPKSPHPVELLSDDAMETMLDEIDESNQSPQRIFSSPMDIWESNIDDDASDEKEVLVEPDYLPAEIKECFEIAIDAALGAGQLITQFIYDTASKSQSLMTKMNKHDFQTLFDSRTETLIINKIKARFPKHEIIAEESATQSEFVFSDNVTWIIDPIDGTTNFLAGQNNVGISIGLKYKQQSICGVVFIPLWHELFFAVKGKGAWMMSTYNYRHTGINGMHRQRTKIERIYTNQKYEKIESADDLSKAMVLLECGYRRDIAHCTQFSNIMCELLSKYKVRGVRMFGCCSVHMCCVASGRADVFFETGNLKPWDMVAGEVIVAEAGGHCVLANGDPFVCTKGQVLCCQSKETAKVVVDLDLLIPSKD